MHHIALNGAGAHQGHFDGEVIKIARLKARQHVDLGAAFHLEHADRVALTQHVVSGHITTWNAGEIKLLAGVRFKIGKGFPDAGEHSQSQNIHLHQAQGLNVVLIPFNESALCHGRIANGHQFIQTPTRQNKAAHMLRQMARKTDNALGEFHHAGELGVSRIKPGLADLRVSDFCAPTAPLRGRNGGGYIF